MIPCRSFYAIICRNGWRSRFSSTGAVLRRFHCRFVARCWNAVQRDIFGAVLKVHDSKKLLWINKLTVLTVTLAALVFIHSHLDSSVLQWNYLSMALRGAGVYLPMTAVIFFKGMVGKKAGLLSMFGGIASGCAWHFIFPTSPYTYL